MSIGILSENLSLPVPAVNLGAELSNMSCSFPGIDFEAFDQNWSCPKVMMEAAVSPAVLFLA